MSPSTNLLLDNELSIAGHSNAGPKGTAKLLEMLLAEALRFDHGAQGKGPREARRETGGAPRREASRAARPGPRGPAAGRHPRPPLAPRYRAGVQGRAPLGPRGGGGPGPRHH